MDWLLRKGDLMLTGKPKVKSTEFHWKFSLKDPTERHVKFVTYDGKDSPEALLDLPSGMLSQQFTGLSGMITAYSQDESLSAQLQLSRDSRIRADPISWSGRYQL